MAFLLCVRHGETDWNLERRWQGHSDRRLTPTGLAQAASVADALQAHSFAEIVTSDLSRSVETARPLASARGLPLREVASLREVDVGSWAGLTRAEATARDPEGAARHAAGGTGWDDGETYEELMERSAAAAGELAARHDADADVAVFTHGGVIRALAARALGLPSQQARLRLHAVAHASLTTVHVRRSDDPSTWQLVCYNRPLAAQAMPAIDVT